MSSFGYYFTTNMLVQMKWPRTQGVLKKKYVDTSILDHTVDQMVDWAAAIGAGKPKLALRVLAYMFNDVDWSGSDAPQLKKLADAFNERHKQEGLNLDQMAPHKVVKPVHFADELGPSISPDLLENNAVRNRLEQDFLMGLLYGLSNPKSYEAWQTHEQAEFNKNKDTYQKMGMDSNGLPSLEQVYHESEDIILDYEKDTGIKLPSIPEKLLADAKALRKG